jgi:hypothetical protein
MKRITIFFLAAAFSLLASEASAHPGSGIAGYNIYRSSTSGSYGSLPTANSLTNQYSDLDLPVGTYFYVITAFSSAGESSDSNEETATVVQSIVQLYQVGDYINWTVGEPAWGEYWNWTVMSIAGDIMTVNITIWRGYFANVSRLIPVDQVFGQSSDLTNPSSDATITQLANETLAMPWGSIDAEHYFIDYKNGGVTYQTKDVWTLKQVMLKEVRDGTQPEFFLTSTNVPWLLSP